MEGEVDKGAKTSDDGSHRKEERNKYKREGGRRNGRTKEGEERNEEVAGRKEGNNELQPEKERRDIDGWLSRVTTN